MKPDDGQIMLSFEMSRSVGWFGTDVSGLCMCPVFKGQAAEEAVQASP